ncbi:MAG TPA: hypothetical protein VK480_03095, partial [Solirubrobacterales bacterium]|nr:hypothetical protein [Solirubrobacterales bacterium]
MSKLVKACIAMAAFVALAVVPASAFAVNDGHLYSPTNETLVVSHEKPIPILGTNTKDTLMTNSAGETLVSCKKAEVTGNLETNTGTPNFIVEGTVHKAEF